jgi:PPK2 family polyphosphate:nucleotide phosphotransferase
MKIEKIIRHCRIDKPQHFRLAQHDPAERFGLSTDAEDVKAGLAEGIARLEKLQQDLYADGRWAVLMVLQGMDAAGKDGVIKHVMSGINPEGCEVHSFKAPTEEERAHDFLWRIAKALPERGHIGIFNRSHYEEVLVVRVHQQLLERQHMPPAAIHGELWKRRYREINDWERYLVDNGFRIVKLLLNISREEQRKRFLARIEVPEKNWKFSSADITERACWDDYQRAFSEMLSHTSTEWAPWHVIPADHKWFARIAVGALLVQALMDIDPQYPKVDAQELQALRQAKAKLEAEGA